MLKDAIIFKMIANDKEDYLDDCWIAEQTKADRGKLRQVFGRKDDNT